MHNNFSAQSPFPPYKLDQRSRKIGRGGEKEARKPGSHAQTDVTKI